MCTALKEDFLPYVDTIVPILIKTANQEIELPVDEEVSDFFDDMDEVFENMNVVSNLVG